MRYRLSTIAALITLVMSSQSFANDTIHAFGGQSVNVPVADEHIPPETCETSTARLVQASYSLGMTIDQEITGLCGETISVALPDVKRSTKLLLTLDQDSDNSNILQEIVVYPNDLMEPLAGWSTGNILRVEDTTGKLESFLEAYNIVFEGRYNRKLEEPQAKILAGNGEIVFMETDPAFPKITIEQNKITIDMPFLEGLETDPLKQAELVQLFEKLGK